MSSDVSLDCSTASWIPDGWVHKDRAPEQAIGQPRTSIPVPALWGSRLLYGGAVAPPSRETAAPHTEIASSNALFGPTVMVE